MTNLYSKLRKSAIAAATIGFMGFSAPVQAAPVVVDFTFTDIFTAESFTGTILGLDNEITTVQEATSLVVSSSFFGSSSPVEFIPSGTVGDFTFDSVGLSSVKFNGFANSFAFDIEFSSLDSLIVVLDLSSSVIKEAISFDIQFTGDKLPVSAVPIPPAGILFGSGLVVLAAMRRRAKKQATA